MIGPMQATRANGRANEMLRRYARWEYGAADADWILAGLRTTRTRSAPGSLRRLVAGRGVPAVRIVGHPHARL